MNITIITSLFPYPLNSGGAQAQYNIIDVLRKTCNISIVFPVNGKNKPEALTLLRRKWPEVTFCPYSYACQLRDMFFLRDKIVRAFNLFFRRDNENFQMDRIIKPYGFSYGNDFISFVNEIIKSQRTDIVQIDFYPYLHLVNYLQCGSAKTIFIHHEIRFVRNTRLLKPFRMTESYERQYEQVKQEEINDLNRFDKVVTLTEVDKAILQKSGVNVGICVSPAAVNTPVLKYKGWNGHFVFVGGVKHIPNKEGMDWFVDNVASLLRFRIVLDMIGVGWTDSSYSHDNVDFRAHGFVENLQDVAYGSIMIVPILSGSGMRMKILEAAAMGIPFITTSVGVEGIDMKNMESCLIADTPEDFAAAMEMLISDEALRGTLTSNAHAVYKKNYSVAALAGRRSEIYKSLLID